MPQVLTISSQVVHGHVGNTATAFALERLGHEALQLPTVILSNHPGHEIHAGFVTDVGKLRDMVDTLDRRGILTEVDAILSGYLPTTAHVDLVAEAVTRVRAHNPNAFYCCDPAVGDDPNGLYVKDATANALNAKLLPLADLITPNRFELNFLSGHEVSDIETAQQASERLAKPAATMSIAATSIPADECNLANLLTMKTRTIHENVLRLPNAPHGTGDLFAALLVGYHLHGNDLETAFRTAVTGVDAVLAASTGKNELELSASQNEWAPTHEHSLI